VRSVPYPFHPQMAKVQLLKLSEKSWTRSQRSLRAVERFSFAHIVLRIAAKFMLGALLKPLFGQFLWEVRCISVSKPRQQLGCRYAVLGHIECRKMPTLAPPLW
jgi:hypothetical protein